MNCQCNKILYNVRPVECLDEMDLEIMSVLKMDFNRSELSKDGTSNVDGTLKAIVCCK